MQESSQLSQTPRVTFQHRLQAQGRWRNSQLNRDSISQPTGSSISSKQLGEKEHKGDDDFYKNLPQQSQPEQTSSMIPYYVNNNDGNQDDFAMIVETDDVPDSSFGEGDTFDLSALAEGTDDDMIANMLGKPGN